MQRREARGGRSRPRSARSRSSRGRASRRRGSPSAPGAAPRAAPARTSACRCAARAGGRSPFLCACRNSIGSSMVRMCSARVSLIRSMIAASVDDLPDPVGPVTSTMPFLSAAMSASAGGRFSSASVGIFDGDHAHDDRRSVPRWRKTLTRKRARPGSEYERSQAPCSFSVRSACSLPPIRSRAMRAVSSASQHRQAGIVDGGQLAVLLDLRRPPGREDQVADARCRNRASPRSGRAC